MSEQATQQRYAAAAQQKEDALCCPVDYDPRFLTAIPQEVIEKDYGCGDPSRYLKTGETVLDLGSGAGKICFIAAQIVGPEGRVIGVDMTDEMLEVARRNAPVVAKAIGFANVEFRKGKIQDLQTAPERPGEVLVESGSVDVVVSNCVLNLVESAQKEQLFAEIYRVLKPGGRAVISDIVSNVPVPAELKADPELWSGCISGALTRKAFLGAFVEAGFESMQTLKFDSQPWRTVAGIQFHAMTIEARKEELADNDADSECCCGPGCC